MQTQVYVGTSARTGGSISGVFRRAAGGGAWTHAIDGFADDTHVHAITVHPDDSATVFAATSTGLYRSRDHGNRWTRLVEPATDADSFGEPAEEGDKQLIKDYTS